MSSRFGISSCLGGREGSLIIKSPISKSGKTLRGFYLSRDEVFRCVGYQYIEKSNLSRNVQSVFNEGILRSLNSRPLNRSRPGAGVRDLSSTYSLLNLYLFS